MNENTEEVEEIYNEMSVEDELKYYLDDTLKVFFEYLNSDDTQDTQDVGMGLPIPRGAMLQICGDELIELLEEWHKEREFGTGNVPIPDSPFD